MMIVPFLHNCILQDCYNNIPDCDGEHGISYYSTYHFATLLSDTNRFCMDFIVCVSLHVRFKVSWGLENMQFSNCSIATSTGIFDLNSELGLGLESSTGNLDWHLHICRGGHNMFFYNCQTRKQLLIILLYHQSFIVFSCNLSQSYY